MNSQWDTVVERHTFGGISVIEYSGFYFLTEGDYHPLSDPYHDDNWMYEHESEIISRGLTEW